MSEQTTCVRRKRFGSLTADETKRLRVLEHESSRLKKLVAERDLDCELSDPGWPWQNDVTRDPTSSSPTSAWDGVLSNRHEAKPIIEPLWQQQ